MVYFLFQIETFGVTDGFLVLLKQERIYYSRDHIKKGDESENLYF